MLLFTLTTCFNGKKISCYENITGYLKNHWTKDRLVCIHFPCWIQTNMHGVLWILNLKRTKLFFVKSDSFVKLWLVTFTISCFWGGTKDAYMLYIRRTNVKQLKYSSGKDFIKIIPLSHVSYYFVFPYSYGRITIYHWESMLKWELKMHTTTWIQSTKKWVILTRWKLSTILILHCCESSWVSLSILFLLKNCQQILSNLKYVYFYLFCRYICICVAI